MMRRALESLAEALEREPEREVGRLDVLPAAERHRLVVEWNATDASYPQDACVHELFAAQAARDPAATAVVYEDRSLSYGELNAEANRLAHHLRALGVGPDVRVAICVERSLEMVVGLLAILKAGGAYVPLDPAYPGERLAFMLADAAPAAVLTHGPAQAALAAARAGLERAPPVIDLEADAALWASAPETDPDRAGLTAQHLAYVIYTSGSTGTPKGVMIEHCNVVALTVGNRLGAYHPGERTAVLSNPSFDASTFEVWFALLNGGSAALLTQDDDPRCGAFRRSLRRNEVTCLSDDGGPVRGPTPAHLPTRTRSCVS